MVENDVLVTYGPLGVGVLALGHFAYRMINLLIRDRDKASAQRDELVEDVMNKVMPAISRNTEMLEKRYDLDSEVVEVIRANNALLDEIRLLLRSSRG